MNEYLFFSSEGIRITMVNQTKLTKTLLRKGIFRIFNFRIGDKYNKLKSADSPSIIKLVVDN